MSTRMHQNHSRHRRARVGIWGVFGHGNYGNEATLSAVLRRLKDEPVAPTILTISPERASREHGVPAQSIGAPAYGASSSRIRRLTHTLSNRVSYLLGAIRTTRTLDAVIIAGTGGLERTGPFGTPFEIWSLGVACRLLHRKFLLLDIGVDAPRDRLSAYFIRSAGQRATYRSYRDAQSRDNMTAAGLADSKGDPVCTDLAFDLAPGTESERVPRHIALGVMEYRGPDNDDTDARAHYLRRMTELADTLVERGFTITLVCGDDADMEAARTVAADCRCGELQISHARSPEDLISDLATASAAVATRYHTLIFALLAGTPVVSVGYSAKHGAMLAQLGLPELHSDSADFEPDAVATQIEQCAADFFPLHHDISAGTNEARRLLDTEWPRVINHLTTHTRRH